MVKGYKVLSSSILNKLKSIVGENSFYDDFAIRWTYAYGGITFQKHWIPDLILKPQTTKQISEILRIADKEKIPITPRGTGTSLSGGQLTPYKGIVLDLTNMNRIISIDIGNNLVELEPGVICDDLNNVLKKNGYFFPPDPGSSSVATIGGMVASNAGGIQAFKYGVTKHYVMYLEVVVPSGKILRLGSEVLKSVATYNIKDLFVGSEGTLGVITKIGLKIRPLPKYRKLGFFIFETPDKIQNAVLDIRKEGIIPNVLEFMDKIILDALSNYLGGDFREFPNGYVLLAEVDGDHEEQINTDFSKLYNIITKYGPIYHKIAQDEKERYKFIFARKSSLPALSRIKPTCCVEDCTIKISDFAEVIKKIENIPEKIGAENLEIAISCHMEGNLHPKFMFNENNSEDLKYFTKAINYLYRKIIIPVGGSITGEHGIGKVKGSFIELEHGIDILDIMFQMKRIFDPNNILNPGIGKGDKKPIKKVNSIRNLINYRGVSLEFNCMRCGFCVISCPSWLHYNIEAYSPRGRLSILNGLVYGDLKINDFITNIIHSCTLCGLCLKKCPSGVNTLSIFEKIREILHK